MKNVIIFLIISISLISCTQNNKTQEITKSGNNAETSVIEVDEKNQVAIEEMKTVVVGDNISIHYIGSYKNGEIFDSSVDRKEVLSFKVGAGQTIPGFDTGVVDMKVGDTKSLELYPEQAYGGLEVSFPKEAFESYVKDGEEMKAGSIIEVGQGKIKIIDIKDGMLVIENTHPLAGKELNFDIELMSIN